MGHRALVVALLVGCASCLKPSLTSCPTVDCPANMVCDGRGGCALQAQLTDCEGKADGAACSYPGVSDGACTSGLCLPVGCGNDIQTPNEVCDDGNTNNGDGCSADCKSNETCGNSIPDPAMGEQCDDGNTVQDDGCHNDCQFARCGDGVTDTTLNEACDNAELNSNDPNGCRPNCQLPRCGDDILDTGEVCDDGNVINGDDCSADCTSTEICGNGIVDAFKGEVCDDGGTIDGDQCSADCKSTEACGNTIIDTLVGEVCDDGNTINGDGCSSDCKSTEGCGNGIVDTFREQCDLGDDNSDAPNSDCRLDCQLPKCGDEVLDDELGEECDDGLEEDPDATPDGVFNSNSPNARCRKNCQLHRCGDGIEDPTFGEVCDDGNSTSGDDCSADCKSLEVCGNAIIDAVNDEQCDKGTGINADTPDAQCRTTCVLPKCGDGIKDPVLGEGCDDPGGNSNAANATCRTNCQPQRCGDNVTDDTKGEVCDDGNAVPGDGCSADCKSREICGNGIVDVVENELCDAGAAGNNNNPNAACRPLCVLPRCGDGVRDDISLGEACDLGNANSNTANATCRTNCELRRCGDGIKDTSFGEVCDDGNLASGDNCSADCKSLETCGNGIVDFAKNEQCDDANSNNFDQCHNNCRLPLCGDGIQDFNEQCDLAGANSDNPNSSCRANCTLPRCGDNIVDNLTLGEVCDDGNLITGDTCRPDCKSNLTCGNQIVDLEMNEQCDDGNLRNRDGCGACKSEDLITLTPGQTPPPRRLQMMAYDGARQRVVMFGGLSAQSAVLADTWEWDGVSWTQMRPKKSPPARHGSAMSYDQKRKRVVLWGGFTQNASKTDTWEWNGIDWVERTPVNTPFNNGFHSAMAYDATRGTMILSNCQTFEWDGNDWKVLSPAGNPCVNGPTLAYDAARNQIVMVAGTQTFVWSGAGVNGSWTSKGSVTGFPTGFRQPVVYDASIGKVVLSGGTASVTWEWNGTVWAQVNAAGSPSVRQHTAATYDAVRRHVVLFGGFLNQNGSILGDTMLRRATTWSFASPFNQPFSRMAASATYDPLRKRVVMFGGDQNCIPCGAHSDETWEWDGRQFIPISGARPIPQAGTSMVYNAATQSVMMLATSFDFAQSQGNTDGFGTLDRLFTFDGTDWTEVPAPDHPHIRNTSLVYDEVNNLVMSFGGRNDDTGETTQALRVWTPDFGWFDIDDGGGPPRRLSGVTTAYDPIRQRTVLFGGKDENRNTLDDLWEWDGGGWTEFAARGPSARFGHTAFYNPDARQISVFGNASNASNTEDLWDWNGEVWTQRQIDSASETVPRYKTAVAYDAARHQVFTFGGRDNSSGTTALLGLMQYRAGATTEACTYATLDYDKDGQSGCLDDECWSVCTPLCPPGSPTGCATSTPRCGDGQCGAFEDCNMCPGDCGLCSGTCGDFSCGVGENVSNCPNDC